MPLAGIVPRRTSFGTGLSGAVREAIPDPMARILGELSARVIWWEVVV
ncbi:hypothetical protein SBA3_4810016 [Candidatus Sulfopaludibacter sp. SbA3]|nr:hypothetical protein SBA3_4810016 [Candidatus Sulfopaludibacter sp. SbA3]